MIDYVVSVRHKGGGERGLLLIGAEDKKGAECLLHAQRFLFEATGEITQRSWTEKEYRDSMSYGTEGLKGEVHFHSWVEKEEEVWPGKEAE